MTESLPALPARCQTFGNATALVDENGSHSYAGLFDSARQVAAGLLPGRTGLQQERIAFLVPPCFDYVATLWGIWMAGGIAVPLCVEHPAAEWDYILSDTGAARLIFDPRFTQRLRFLSGRRTPRRIETLQAVAAGRRVDGGRPALPSVPPEQRAMILYTSGTTGRPKGVVSTHQNLEAQVRSLVQAWEWNSQDRILNVLPLHHTHGIVNVLCCALWSGATCELMPRFDAAAVWKRFAQGGLTLFMSVPTIYIRLIEEWERASAERRLLLSQACRGFRLMVSGSAALPVKVLRKWKAISGHILLERYGMTEVGMALSNPLRGRRRPGCVGSPLPGVEARRVDDSGNPLQDDEVPGEIQVRGPGVFLEYWNRPRETSEAFCDGWFRTGDVGCVTAGAYRILGRTSTDIIKTGGYKVSALEIEDVLCDHPGVRECAVVGSEDETWGERVCAAVVWREGRQLELDALREWAAPRLATYKIPSLLLAVTELPRNSMGKVMKPEVRALFER